ncbi:MAG: aminotransferase class V-fold PLP-dependent enzyme [Gammaproteobacteria bacterium]|nr:aminotransferase class V-fold PLP-dependent enzyme [Gammaproteobacteria bacterium]MCP4879792.1 aminotransferase class V-fold PLP-dependent enzyme [Gammaproteobacteria bacterium]
MTQLDMRFVRRQFPAFTQPSLKDTCFFENAGGSYLCQPVLDRFDTYLAQLKLQPYHASPAATKAGQWMDASYEALAPWLNVSPAEIYFGPSTSQNTYVLSQAAWGWLQPGDEIIVTNQDHEANSGVWRRLAERGIEVREWQVEHGSGKLLLADLRALLGDKTKLLVFPHCSNILGDINPVKEICNLARAHGVRTVVDGVSFAGHGIPDCAALAADIYLFSLYKVYGPHLGVMVIKPDMAALLSNQSHFFNSEDRAKRLYPAGPDHAQVAAAKGVAEYFCALYQHHFAENSVTDEDRAEAVRGLLHKAENHILQLLLSYLSGHSNITLVGPLDIINRAPTVSIIVAGHNHFTLCRQLGEQGIMCGAGHFYSYRLLQAMGMDPEQGVLRFSMVHYTSAADVGKLITCLDALVS